MRGWSSSHCPIFQLYQVFPAHAGVILKSCTTRKPQKCISRTCGGDPLESLREELEALYFPHMRGWSSYQMALSHLKNVFPAHAGVILTLICSDKNSSGYFPHMRGWSYFQLLESRKAKVFPAHAGVILHENLVLRIQLRYFPHMRGWSPNQAGITHLELVFPAHAGVIPDWGIALNTNGSISRTCGGDPGNVAFDIPDEEYFPHMRGWSY